MKPDRLPRMCEHHAGSYATRAKRLTNRVHYPDRGLKALAREAATVAKQCPECPDPPRRDA